MPQSTHLRLGLPASICLAAMAGVVGPVPSYAQDRFRVIQTENFRREPSANGRLLAQVRTDTEMLGSETRDGWVRVTLEGFIWRQSLRPVNSTDYDFEVAAPRGENLRASPNGAIVARLERGFWVEEVSQEGDWARVRRTGWMWGRSLARAGAAGDGASGQASAEPGTQASAQGGDPQGDDGTGGQADQQAAVTLGPVALRAGPHGDSTGTLVGNAPVEIVARSGDWVRVRAEGWVRDDELRRSDGAVLVGVAGADVRARPAEFTGRTLEWRLQYLSVQVSDGLRPEIPNGTQYMLARGPIPEAGFVYVLLTTEQAREIERLSSLAQIVTRVRVLVGRDRYLGNPVVELIDLSVRKP